ncbi:hypothetical protein COE65_14275 [Bacillus sp. AFS051223]|uniref:hypothetical protein n=1 Tax=Bacillus sp. AFS051223 TaxID=2034280 RepID=UPI000BFEA8ED|nr:hypothetical protein [Bacillus sp. AFS051223]PHA10355.1 hypothetical protein COE65_14275 [Bacillus sp. AFS051223]
MSLISIVATKKFVSFVSDGRGTKEGEIIYEDYRKVFKINDKVIIGIAGDSSVIEILIPQIHNIEDLDLSNAKSCAHSLFNMLGNNKIKNKDMTIMVGGLDDLDNIYYAGFIHSSTKLDEVIPEGENVRCGSTITEKTNALNPNAILQKLIKNSIQSYEELLGFTSNDSFNVQKEFNHFISEKDDSVNNHLFQEVICK